jgi:transketolase
MAQGTATREGDHETHGAPLPAEEIAATKRKMGLPEGEAFHAPQDVIDHFRTRFPAMRAEAAAWRDGLADRLEADPVFAGLWNEVTRPRSGRTFTWPSFEAGKKVATRSVWGKCLNGLIDQLPFLVGGSADLDPSNMTADFRKKTCDFGPMCRDGRSLAYGVREFPMAAVVNGLALHGGFIPFGATFLTFADYGRNGLRMSALQELPALHVFTHDSFYLGEDGPTHQPVEHASSLRLIPNMLVLRPAEAVETCACLELALTQDHRPTCLLLTRQGLPVFGGDMAERARQGVRRGAYVVSDPDDSKNGAFEIVVIASGSEVSLAMEAAALLPGRKIRIVSMPSMELFEEQPKAYRDEVLPPSVTNRVAVEAGRPDLWYRFVGLDGLVLGMSRFGASAPAEVLAKEYGFTPENLARLIDEKF